MTNDLKRMLDWFSELQAIDTADVTPALQASMQGEGHLRPDDAVEFAERQVAV